MSLDIPDCQKTEYGTIPSDWLIGELRNILAFQCGAPFASLHFRKDGIGVRLIRNRDLKSNDDIVSYDGIYEPNYVVKNGDVLVSMDGDFISCCWNNGEALLNQRVGRVLPKGGNLAKYLYYILVTPLRRKQEGTGATTVKHLSHSDVEKLVVPYTLNIQEQRAIATALSDVDALIEAKQALLEKKRAIKQGAMQELLTGHRRLPGFPVTPMKKTDIGEIPEDWNVCKMGKNGTFLTTASYTRSELSQYGDVACIHYGDIHTKYKTWLSLNREEVPHIDYSKVKNYPYLRDGDLIIADASEDYAGLSDWVELTDCQDKKCIGGLHTIVFRPIEDIFAFGYLGLISSLGVVKKQLISKTVGTKVYSLTASMLKDLLFPLPSTEEEQAAIHNIIWCMDNEVKAIEAEITKLRDLKQGMMRELLTGRIRLVK